ncbi:hypothetical protein DVR12_20380 [Chitinophaga silvatica]|uniref:IrrE N-terminal-like domain-containing protein n=1 Tax=Chitinophaga silvatica TaxID=2282649 RepID=A0A3E1Y5R9_9BACT|nr:hypothetical protein [Chitinophaga silvatica]RFS20079.1 hypothetical protein DVR12_20380 [Chitinophaga silvatica]
MPDNEFANELINNLFRPEESLRDLFEERIRNLDTSTNAVLPLLEMQSRALDGILDGTQKMVDFTNLVKLANFLQLPLDRVVKLYAIALEKYISNNEVSTEKIRFIKENFDLAVLRKAGFINTLGDFKHIENKLLNRLGLNSIYEYRKPENHVAFSAGIIQPKNELTRALWITTAKWMFEELDNPYPYHRQQLIEYIPQIRWHCTNVEKGLIEVIRSLYKLGITVIYQPPMPTLQLRGATMTINTTPCIVLTDLMGFYGTLWFALMHELYHVLFDLEDISTNSYHITEDGDDIPLTVKERDKMADNFARTYLFSVEKSTYIKKYLQDETYVKQFAEENHVHYSMIYLFQAFDSRNSGKYWAMARKTSPGIAEATNLMEIPWNEEITSESLQKQKKEIYN